MDTFTFKCSFLENLGYYLKKGIKLAPMLLDWNISAEISVP